MNDAQHLADRYVPSGTKPIPIADARRSPRFGGLTVNTTSMCAKRVAMTRSNSGSSALTKGIFATAAIVSGPRRARSACATWSWSLGK